MGAAKESSEDVEKMEILDEIVDYLKVCCDDPG